MKNKTKKSLAKGTASILNAFLCVDANSTSCIISYQPKAPDELVKFRRMK